MPKEACGVVSSEELTDNFVRISPLRFHNLEFSYPKTQLKLFKDFDLTIPPGASIGIVGESGSGKSSLIKLLCRFYEPTAGQVMLGTKDIASFDKHRWREQIALV